MTRVLFVINSLEGGGAERVMARLLRQSLDKSKVVELHLALLDKTERVYPVPDWVTIHELDSKGALANSVFGLLRLAKSLQPNVIISFLTRSNISSIVCRVLLHTPAIISERVSTTAHLGSGLRAAIAKALVMACYRFASVVIAVSKDLAGELVVKYGVGPDRICVIYNSVDIGEIRALAGELPKVACPELFLLAMGRLTENKNFSLLIDAFLSSDCFPHLMILGEGPERLRLLEKIKSLGAESRISLPGFVTNPFPILARASAFVLPSNAEGFPNSLVEAMALGIPVVSTDCPTGPSEILSRYGIEVDGMVLADFGILVPSASAVHLVEALRTISKEEYKSIYARRGVSRAEEYSPDQFIKLYWAVIERVLGAPSGGGEIIPDASRR